MTDEEAIKRVASKAEANLNEARSGLVEILAGTADEGDVQTVQANVIEAEVLLREIQDEYV